MQDIRWHLRLRSFDVALKQTQRAVHLSKTRALTDLEKLGLIHTFEFTHELAWNVLKDYFEHQGTTGITGSRDASREGFNKGLITDGDMWMEMIKSRNQTTHTYDQKTAEDIVSKIKANYVQQFEALKNKMQSLV